MRLKGLAAFWVFCLFAVPAVAQTQSMRTGARDLRLVEAVKNQDTPAVRSLLRADVNVNAGLPDGVTALHWATYRDDQEIADLLIRAGANVNAVDDHGASALWLASLNGNARMVESFLKAGADPNMALLSGETPLMAASRSGNVTAVKSLLAHGAKVDVQETSRRQTALMWAVAQQHAEAVQALVEAGSNLHSRTIARDEVHSVGIYQDWTHLIDFKAGGFTALLFAARNGDTASARILLDAGANVNDTAASGASALVVAIHSGHDALANLLIDKGADVNAMDGGYAPLHIAVRAGNQAIVKQLLARGANIHALVAKPTGHNRSQLKDITIHYSFVGTPPLWIAARLGDVDMMRLLIANGADRSFVAPDGGTLLMAPVTPHGLPAFTASEERSLSVIKAALDFGADINATDKAGNTALHGAANLGFNAVVRFLVDHGATLDVKNAAGQTPLALTLPMPQEFGDRIVEQKSTSELLRTLGARE